MLLYHLIDYSFRVFKLFFISRNKKTDNGRGFFPRLLLLKVSSFLKNVCMILVSQNLNSATHYKDFDVQMMYDF